MFQQFYAGSDLLVWPVVGLGIFILSFLAVVSYVFLFMRRGDDLERVAALPLDDDERAIPGREASGHE
jgi:hypothetical protein